MAQPLLGGGFVEGAITGLLYGVLMKVSCGESKRPGLQFTRTTEQCANQCGAEVAAVNRKVVDSFVQTAD
jgi:hypothetical protein